MNEENTSNTFMVRLWGEMKIEPPKVVIKFVIYYAGCRAGRVVGSGSQSTASATSIWFWSATSRVQGISWGWAWKDPGLVGWAWAVTGDRIGNQMLFWLDSHSHSGSQAVTVALPPRGTLSRPTGNSVKPSPEKTSESKKISNFPP